MTKTLEFDEIKSVKAVPDYELYVSGHRTCQGCESALAMRLMIKAAGPRTIVIGSTGCMYVANTSYYTTPWAVPWMHTQLGASGSAALGAAAGLKALMRKGKIKQEKMNVIAYCGDLGGADMGLSAISGALTQSEYNFLILMYDNESAANTDIQATSTTTWGAQTTFTPSGVLRKVTHNRWKKNVIGMLAAGHPNVKYLATACTSYHLDFINKIRKALAVGGPTFIHVLCPCPKGWDYHPMYSHEIGKLAVETGMWPLSEIVDNKFRLNGVSESIADGKVERKHVEEYLRKQGRFAHLTDEDVGYIQGKVDEMWEKWLIPCLMPTHPE